jgi:hypothetical protein
LSKIKHGLSGKGTVILIEVSCPKVPAYRLMSNVLEEISMKLAHKLPAGRDSVFSLRITHYRVQLWSLYSLTCHKCSFKSVRMKSSERGTTVVKEEMRISKDSKMDYYLRE